jgi:multiple sugar transport system substrate-binding protein
MMPKIERQSGVAHSLAFAMSANSAHKPEAWKYIEFMSSEASQTELAKAVIPANKLAAKAWAAEIKKVDVTPYIDTLNVTEAYPTAGTNTPKWQNMWIASLKKIFMGADAKAEMDKSVKKIERVMEQ